MIRLVILILTILGAFGGFYFKLASNEMEKINIKNILLNKYLYMGATLYLISAIMNIYVLKYGEYSKILPLTSITYIWTILIAKFILKEKITFYKYLGVIFIILGAIILVK